MLRTVFAILLLATLVSCSNEEEMLKVRRDIANVQEQIYELESKQAQVRADIMSQMKVLERKLDDRTAVADTQDRLHRVKQELSEYKALLHDLEGKIAEMRATQSRVALAAERGAEDTGEGENPDANGLDNGMNTDMSPITEVSGDVVQGQYRQAYLDFNRGKYDVAIEGFRGVLQNFPNSPYTEKAMYYLGTSLYQQEKYQEAREQFTAITKQFPSGSFLKQSMYYEGRCYYSLGQLSKAVITLKDLSEKYPGTQEADLASNFLKQTGYER